jgi:hypothetical protein
MLLQRLKVYLSKAYLPQGPNQVYPREDSQILSSVASFDDSLNAECRNDSIDARRAKHNDRIAH